MKINPYKTWIFFPNYYYALCSPMICKSSEPANVASGVLSQAHSSESHKGQGDWGSEDS